MNRDEWIFPYAASKLANAAQAKGIHHEERLAWWNDRKEHTMQTIRADGIEIDESIAEEFSKMSNYARQPSAAIKPELQRDLAECLAKVTEHRTKMIGYEAWAQVLQSQGDSMFDLHHDDWIYFFGK